VKHFFNIIRQLNDVKPYCDGTLFDNYFSCHYNDFTAMYMKMEIEMFYFELEHVYCVVLLPGSTCVTYYSFRASFTFKASQPMSLPLYSFINPPLYEVHKFIFAF
jgi:hypothetical protein